MVRSSASTRPMTAPNREWCLKGQPSCHSAPRMRSGLRYNTGVGCSRRCGASWPAPPGTSTSMTMTSRGSRSCGRSILRCSKQASNHRLQRTLGPSRYRRPNGSPGPNAAEPARYAAEALQVSFSTDIAELVTDQVKRFVTLNRHQLAGHVANLDFWTAEVRHCLQVLDGYGKRFQLMKAAQEKHVAEHHTIEFDREDPGCTQGTPGRPRKVFDGELKKARVALREAARRFWIRCYTAGLIAPVVFGRLVKTRESGSMQLTWTA